MQQLASLAGSIKHYDWGGTSYIPSLLQIENPNLEPFAEYWLGVHPQADCKITLANGTQVLLRDYVEQDLAATLGSTVLKRFGNLPYLLKVLDVKDMLSIQVHPSKAQAAIDFEKENETGVPLTAPDRNYKDANHKPELMVAMSEFYLLHGFKPEEELISVLDKVKELKKFKAVFKKKGYAGLYKMSMEMPQDEVNTLLQSLLARIIPLYQNGQLEKSNEDFWAARAALTFGRPGVIDRGIFSVYFFNLVHLTTGQAIFQDAGVPHAYLEGQNVEIMASSDNVLRGGLTTKHIDTVELLKHTRCEATHPKILKPAKGKSVQSYKAPVKDFTLTSYQLKKGESIVVDIATAEIFLLMQGKVTLQSKKIKVALAQPNITAAAFAGAAVTVKAVEDSWLFKAAAR
ncbi:mannose-6-phosphate isomerase, class I [Niabella yanshanensis]|uniref:mannose-6-phosphate isomerase n=1 Tax=Niabella yanshanensis TaxID=577386 RepID=A0ABZ0W4T0_9BACT|nr:mannose-6-phosphate isomerase, class I [Niabella yanshanensis]WQD37559.1 mannose-6-phosphate isomerase, class I [Niabella yanshanensis]